MLWAYQQNVLPFESFWLSLIVAALPVVVLFCLLVPVRMAAPKAALSGALVALFIAWAVYGMPAGMAFMALHRRACRVRLAAGRVDDLQHHAAL